LLQEQAMRVGQRRVELRMQMAALERKEQPWSGAKAS
jgi:hypothetical protein